MIQHAASKLAVESVNLVGLSTPDTMRSRTEFILNIYNDEINIFNKTVSKSEMNFLNRSRPNNSFPKHTTIQNNN